MTAIRDAFMILTLIITMGLLTHTLGKTVPLIDTFLELSTRVDIAPDEDQEGQDEPEPTKEYDPPLPQGETAQANLDYLLGE